MAKVSSLRVLYFDLLDTPILSKGMSKCETVGFPGPNESWIKIRSNRNLVEYKLTCGQKQFWFQDPIFSKYIVDM